MERERSRDVCRSNIHKLLLIIFQLVNTEWEHIPAMDYDYELEVGTVANTSSKPLSSSTLI